MGQKWTRRLAKFSAIVIVGIAIIGTVIMSLWNWLVPNLFGGPQITFWQAVALFALCRILFGNFRGAGDWKARHWRRRMMERWEQMTPEERDRFREGMRQGLKQSPFASPEQPGS